MQATHSELHVSSGEPESDELRGLLALALPLAAANLGQMLLSAVSTAVVGRLGERELGAVGLGSSIFFTFLVVGMGVMLALDPLVSQALGEADPARARRALWQGVWLALVLALPLGALMLAAGALLERAGIDSVSASLTRDYLIARLPGLAPYLWFIAARSYLGAHGATRAVLSSVVLANLVNVPLSLVLVLGSPALGIPSLGVAGAGWAATLATLVELAVLALALARAPLSTPVARGIEPELSRGALRLGLPIGFTLLAEFGVFALVNLLVGVVEPRALAAHQVAITLASVSFTIPVGIGAAAAVKVGHAIGRGDARATRSAGITSLIAAGAFMLFFGGLFLALPRALAGLFTSDEEVIAAAVPLLGIGALFQLSDGVQAVATGALRGAGDTRFPLWANLLGHYAVGLPLGAALAFGCGLGARGLWWGLSVGLAIVALVLALRFIRSSARPIAPV